MADPPTAAKTKVAVTRKHLRRDQAAARKARSTVLPGSDTVKERQQKLKEEREAKRATLDSRHQYLFSAVATKLCVGENDVEEYILDGNQVSWSRKLMELEQETDRAGTQSLLSVALEY